MSDYLPGSFFVTTIPGCSGHLIGIGQALALSPSRYEHAGMIISEDGDTVEAAPGGAFIGNIRNHRTVLISDGPVQKWLAGDNYASGADASEGREKYIRSEVVREAYGLVGIGYSALDYLALALLHLHLPSKWVRRRVQRSGRVICSQLVDLCFTRAGIHLFDDGRLPGDVMPADLAAWAEDWEAGR